MTSGNENMGVFLKMKYTLLQLGVCVTGTKQGLVCFFNPND